MSDQVSTDKLRTANPNDSDDLPDPESAPVASRRTVMRKATKLIYATPLLIATMKLIDDEAAAQAISPVRP